MKIELTVAEVKEFIASRFNRFPNDVKIVHGDGTEVEEHKVDCQKKVNEALLKLHNDIREKAKNLNYEEFKEWKKLYE